MRALTALVLALAALAACASGSASSSSGTSLTIRYFSSGVLPTADPAVWTLRCDPARGTVARPAEACRKLADGGRKLFKPVPRMAVCTEIYGGPDVARVIGVVDGRRVWATFNLMNGCHIGRWNRFSPWLLPRS